MATRWAKVSHLEEGSLKSARTSPASRASVHRDGRLDVVYASGLGGGSVSLLLGLCRLAVNLGVVDAQVAEHEPGEVLLKEPQLEPTRLLQQHPREKQTPPPVNVPLAP